MMQYECRTGLNPSPFFLQAVGVDSQLVLGRVLAQEAEIIPPVVIDKEDILAIVAPLRDVMRATRNHNSRSPWHARAIP